VGGFDATVSIEPMNPAFEVSEHLPISVVMTTFNGERFVDDQLRSILEQSLPPREVVVCDDGSQDRTLDIVHHLANDSAVPVIVDQHENVGLRDNLERGLRIATSSIIALADQDDVWVPDKLRLIEAALEAHPEALVVCTNGHLLDVDGQRLEQSLWDRSGLTGTERADVLAGQSFPVMLRWNFVTGATVAIRRSFLDLSLPLPTEGLHDAWFALLASSLGRLLALDDDLIGYRLHQANTKGLPPDRVRKAIAERRAGDPRPTEAALYEAAARRLVQSGLASSHVLESLDAKVTFTRRRLDLPDRFIPRLAASGRLLRSGEYRRFSKQWPRSVGYDVLVGSPPPASR
jgi:glycosyltransferase involved in cell wall biosynthesis